jgi:phenylacetic acid degradation operon negative regulatory protein
MTPEAALAALIDDLARRRALRAGSFIVTIYGDVVLPRGGSVWMGNVIETCRAVGVNESQARTAVSRLVEAGRLIGARDGRRSFYRLTPAAAAEFARAAAAIHGPGEAAEGAPWTFVALGAEGRAAAQEALARLGFGQVGPGAALKPGEAAAEARAALDAAAAVFVGAPAAPAPGALALLAREGWDLDALSVAYAAFADRFAPLDAALASRGLEGAASLAARLLLVHDFRRVALRDPALPASALPTGWSGRPARALFRALYRRLAPAADAHVAARFLDRHGPLGRAA